MASVIKDFVDDIHAQIVSQSSDANRELAPYYRFGSKAYDTNEGRPRQIRWQKGPWQFTPPITRLPDTCVPSGSNGIILQTLECTIWGDDDNEVIEDLELITKAIDNIKSAASNSTGISQDSLRVQQPTGFWVDNSDRSSYGERLGFTYDVKINIPKTNTIYSLVTSASIEVSASVVGTTGSYAEGKSFTVTSASY